MASDFQDVLRELISIINATWPEINVPGLSNAPANLATSDQATQRSIVEIIKSGQMPTPFVVMEIGDFVPDPDWGLSNNTQRIPIAIYYATKYGLAQNDFSALSQPQLDQRIRLLKKAIDYPATEPTHFQAIEFGAVNTGLTSPVNEALLAASKAGIIGGHVRWDPGLMMIEP